MKKYTIFYRSAGDLHENYHGHFSYFETNLIYKTCWYLILPPSRVPVKHVSLAIVCVDFNCKPQTVNNVHVTTYSYDGRQL